MENIKLWLRKNWSTALMVAFFLLMIFSPDAKAWFLRQVASTGLLNSKIDDAPEELAQENVATLTENLSVRDEAGNVINTSELKGKVVFINFWASWCPPCRAEFPSIQQFYEKYKGGGKVVFLTVNMDTDLSAGQKYLHDEHFTVPFLVPAGQVPQSYFTGALPTTVVLDKSGQIRMNHPGIGDYSSAAFYKQIEELINE